MFIASYVMFNVGGVQQLGNDDTGMGDERVQYYSSPKKSAAENEFDNTIVPILVVGGVLGAIGLAAYTVNKQFYKNSFMGAGRRYNNNYIKNFAMGIQDLEDIPDFKRKELATMSPYIQRQYRTHNIVYPDIMYEGVTKQARPDNTFVSVPIPPSHVTRTQLTYAEPSNIVSDAILYEQGTPDIREDYRITGEIPGAGAGKGRYNRRFNRYAPGGIDEGASNTIFTTEYAPGINEKVRRDNPVVVSKPVVTPSGRVLRKVGRMQSVDIPSRKGRRFNKDYDELGQPLQRYDPIYDTYDALSDLKLTNEDFGEGEAGGRISDDSLKVFEDFVSKGKLRQGWEIIPSED